MAGEVRVAGLKELNRALKRTSKDVRLGIRKELRAVAEPVRSDAETLAFARISHIGVPWSRMRVGVTLDTVYVAPRQRGVGSRGSSSRRRPRLAGLLMDKAMRPALDYHADQIEDRVDDMLGRVANDFSR